MELETAVRLNCNLVHLVWIDGSYDMVKFQQMARFGPAAAVDFGPVDIARIAPTLKQALEMQGPVLIAVPVE